MGFEFIYGNHGDIVLRNGDRNIDLGHNYVVKLPVMLWLYSAQTTRSDIFERKELPRSYDREEYMGSDLEMMLEDSKRIASILPTYTKRFNEKMAEAKLLGFMSGSLRWYEFELQNDDLLYLRRKSSEKNEIELIIAPSQAEKIAWNYIDFIGIEERMSGMKEKMKRVFSFIREYGSIRK